MRAAADPNAPWRRDRGARCGRVWRAFTRLGNTTPRSRFRVDPRKSASGTGLQKKAPGSRAGRRSEEKRRKRRVQLKPAAAARRRRKRVAYLVHELLVLANGALALAGARRGLAQATHVVLGELIGVGDKLAAALAARGQRDHARIDE